MKKTNGQSGITLIALVVTIVVLLILAGITITFVLSDGGIFSTAQKAGEKTNEGAVRDYATNAMAAIVAQYYDSTIPESSKNYSAIFKASFPTNGVTWSPEPTITATQKKVGETDAVTLSVDMQAETTFTWNGLNYTINITDSVVSVVYAGKATTNP